MLLRFIHIFVISWLLLLYAILFFEMCNYLFIHFTIDIYLGCFQVLAFVNHATLIVPV